MILLDTHAVAWMVAQPAKLSPRARRRIERASRTSGLAVASVTLYELARLVAEGRIRVSRSPGDWLRTLVRDAGLSVREVTTDVASVAANLPTSFPADPFDRLITATAIVERLPLVTADARIRASGEVEAVW